MTGPDFAVSILSDSVVAVSRKSRLYILRKAYKILVFAKLKIADALERIRTELPQTPEVCRFVEFIEKSERGICR